MSIVIHKSKISIYNVIVIYYVDLFLYRFSRLPEEETNKYSTKKGSALSY